MQDNGAILCAEVIVGARLTLACHLDFARAMIGDVATGDERLDERHSLTVSEILLASDIACHLHRATCKLITEARICHLYGDYRLIVDSLLDVESLNKIGDFALRFPRDIDASLEVRELYRAITTINGVFRIDRRLVIRGNVIERDSDVCSSPRCGIGYWGLSLCLIHYQAKDAKYDDEISEHDTIRLNDC